MKLIEVDPPHGQCAAAVFDRRGQVFRAAVRHPAAAGASHASLGGDDNGGSIALPRRQGASDESFVVTAIAIGPAVRVRSVEEGYAGIQRRMEHRDRSALVAVRFSREPHATQSKRAVVGHRPIFAVWRTAGQPVGTRA